MRFIGIDPGKTTGYASYDSETGRFHSNEYPTTILFRVLDNICAGDYRPEIVIERFTITARTARLTQQSDALRIIGAVEYIAHQGHASVTFSPTSRKKFGTNGMLKQLGWFHGGEGHADDAARHLLALLVTRTEGAVLLAKLAA